MADDVVKCPLCGGRALLTKDEALTRLGSLEFQETVQGYRGSRLNLPEDSGTPDFAPLHTVHDPVALARKRDEARRALGGWGRRSPKE